MTNLGEAAKQMGGLLGSVGSQFLSGKANQFPQSEQKPKTGADGLDFSDDEYDEPKGSWT